MPSPTKNNDALCGFWRAAQAYIYSRRHQDRLFEQTPSAMPRDPDGFAELWPHLKPITPMDPWRAAGIARRLWEVRNVPGDIIECGVFMGAMSVMMALLLRRWGIKKRIHMVDSFQGLPSPDPLMDHFYEQGWFSASRPLVEGVLNTAGVREDVVLHEGWFKDALPRLTTERFCLAHFDGDLYSSTMDCFTNLVPRMNPGSVVILDDTFDDGGGVLRAAGEVLGQTGEALHAGPVTQSYYRTGKLARDRNRRGVDASITELKKDRAYRAAVKTWRTWLESDVKAARRVNALL